MSSTQTSQANKRLEHLSGHLVKKTSRPGFLGGDVVVVSALRTPLCKAKRGAFKSTTTDDLLAPVLEAVVKQSGVDAATLGDIVVGNVLQPGSGAVGARMAQFYAGIPYQVPLCTLNRQCSSGLQAFLQVAASIQSGLYEAGIAGGVESMSLTDMSTSVPDVNFERVSENALSKDCTIPMGQTSDEVATRFQVSREDQDRFAAASHAKAEAAVKAGKFAEEIVPVRVSSGGEDGGEDEVTVVREDEGIRPGTTPEKLGGLRSSFSEGGSTTAGNSSQMTDGAAAVLVMSRGAATAQGMPVMGVLRGAAVVGVPPDIMGIGPAVAIPAALAQARLRVEDVDVFEINEAFASQCLYCVRELKIPMEKVNPNGGAIALGHPLGATGARQIATLLHEMRRTRKRWGVVSMCIGTGMGAAAVFENEAAAN
ncbi:3-ketoacyl- thiolase peroxisomal [Nannochloropsis gaditana]|uniref:acetyl-CoA C-acyltransferase n=1 Tax=Nannochloropsis gaditana TaxID=72520 RepID=W7TCH2_9STRA|nr:3-ketoacyl- thiolase peroxisomal [Nannochloropsis gaditana]